ncbi:MAG: hypothetical protein QW838_08155 [Candidatus Nitrosotenuis sp.]
MVVLSDKILLLKRELSGIELQMQGMGEKTKPSWKNLTIIGHNMALKGKKYLSKVSKRPISRTLSYELNHAML